MKQICIPTFTEQLNKYIIKQENTPVAVIQNKCITVSGDDGACQRISNFYSVLEEKIRSWTEVDFKDYAKNKYMSDPSPRKKYRYIPLELTKDMTACVRDKDNILEIKIHISLKTKNSLIAEKNIVHLWDLKNGFLYIPPKNKPKKRSH